MALDHDHSEPRYAIGIDLGTTNCALAFVDRLASGDPKSEVLSLPQYMAPGVLGSAQTLPSFLYFLAMGEEKSFEPQRTRPWEERNSQVGPESLIVPGIHARTRARETPGRVVISAKSWLASVDSNNGGSETPGVDAEQAILPWGSSEIATSEKLSPIDASAHFLLALKQAWDSQKAKFENSYRFENQDVVVTVPASFDEVAQRLTIEAARRAGFGPRLRLLEEPQAAFYRFLESEREQLTKAHPGNSPLRLLVCDMGGGTTDFSLFEIQSNNAIERIAVSDHLLLGGDNIDLALARALESKMLGPDQRLSSGQWGFLVQAARALKEDLCSSEFTMTENVDPTNSFRVAVPPEGANLFAAAMTAEMNLQEIFSLVTQGFFPDCERNESPTKRRQGLREIGLPYAVDTAVTRHLAAFLQGNPGPVDSVLFVGGSFTPTPFRQAILGNLERWQGKPVRELRQNEYDLAVARGAAVFASLKKEDKRQIRAGYSHSVYLEVREAKSRDATQYGKLLCVLPQGAEPGSRFGVALPHLKVVLEKAVQFQVFTSHNHPADRPGQTRSWSEEGFHQLAPLQTTVTLSPSLNRPAERGEKIAVALEAEINELGMLQVFLLPAGADSDSQRFELQFNLRAGAMNSREFAESGETSNSQEETIDVEKITEIVNRYFGKKIPDAVPGAKIIPSNVVRELEEAFAAPREEWSLPQLRAVWKPLNAGMSRRSRSLSHEVAWLSLAGYVLRPGYGAPLDTVRVEEVWKAFDQGLFFPKEARAKVQWWIMWRRVTGGLSAERQEKIYRSLQSTVQARSFEASENLLLAGSLERLGPERKKELGTLLIKRLQTSKVGIENIVWTLSRVGARVLLSAGPEFVLSPHEVEPWLSAIIAIDWKSPHLERVAACVVQLGRLTGERALDISPEVRSAALDWLKNSKVGSEVGAPLREVILLDAEERKARFGEVLPAGLELA